MLLTVEADQISAARFRVMREALGFSVKGFATFANVSQGTVSNWDAGKSYVPRGIVNLLRECEVDADRLVADCVEIVQGHPAPTMQTYATDEAYREAEPDAKYPASWHRMVAARVWEKIPDLHINYI